MSKTILQVNYRFTSSRSQHVQMVTPLAEPLSQVPGLIWKIWLMNEADSEAGGIYLFESRESASAFMNSQAIADFVAQPTITSRRSIRSDSRPSGHWNRKLPSWKDVSSQTVVRASSPTRVPKSGVRPSRALLTRPDTRQPATPAGASR